jgi:hypothetical protein
MRVYQLLMHSGAGFFSGSGYNAADDTWTASLDRHRLRAYREIRSIDDYLAIRDAEIAEREAALNATSPSVVRTPRRWLRPSHTALPASPTASSTVHAEPEPPGEVDVDPRLIFVLMPFRQRAHWSDDVYMMIKAVCESLSGTYPNLKCSRADDITELGAVNRQIVDRISSARVIIADITGNNPNVMYELGIADGISKPVILMNQIPNKAPFDIAHLRQMSYVLDNLLKAAADLTSFLSTELGKT